MTTGVSPDDYGALMKKSLLELRQLRARLREVEDAGREPIAVIGMGCRLPGGIEDPEGCWRLLREGRNAVVETPPERWDLATYHHPDPTVPGKTNSRHGGFLDRVDGFDPRFFGISPREATSLDPQQRMLLETSWEALESAGQAPDRLYGSSTGVFVGISSFEYAALLIRSLDHRDIDPYFGTGCALSAAAGRLSFLLGLTGPSMAIDTACSSSLVALHVACQSLRRGECDLALAGGVNLMMAPEVNIAFSKAHLLASDGRCKTFDAAADGYVRGEGCGVVVLKRLSDATANRDPVQALIRGSAVNQDGPSGALVVPNGRSQEAVIRRALESAGVAPEQVGYVEAHGTGTALGDPIEVGALGRVFGPGRTPEHPLVIGSVKTNMGHLESAAGIAGLIKVVLSLRHGAIPPHLHYQTPNPQIPWQLLPAVVPTEPRPWPRGERPRFAGLSSFGFTGTNAHVVLEEAPPVPPADPGPRRPLHLLTLSAKSETALETLATRFRDHLDAHPELDTGDLCFTANTGRAQFPERLTVVADSAAEFRRQLAEFVTGNEVTGNEVTDNEVAGNEDPSRFRSSLRKAVKLKTAFLFAGEGALEPGMGRQLYDTHPDFRSTLDRCGELLRPELEKPLLEAIFAAPEDGAPLGGARYAHPALFALEVALARLWQSWGVRPAALLGHGVGEYAAACVAGVFSLEDGLELVARRARRIGELPGDDPSMEPVVAELAEAAREVTFSPPRLRLISGFTGGRVEGEVATAEHWVEHARGRARFDRALETLEQTGVDARVEIPGRPEWRQLAGNLARLASRGAEIDWEGFDRPYPRRRVPLPTYPFERQRFWVEASRSGPATPGPPAPEPAPEDLFYRVDWRPQPRPEAAPGSAPASDPEDPGSWLLFADGGGVAAGLAERLRTRGEEAVLVFPGGELRQTGEGEYRLDPGDPGDFARLFREALAERPPLRAAVHCWGLDATTSEGSTPEEVAAAAALGCRTALELVRTLDGHRASAPPRLWLVTRGAQRVGSETELPGVVQASLWGLARVAAVELPDFRCTVVDLDPAGGEDDAGLLFDELWRGPGAAGENPAFRAGRRHLPRLVRHPAPEPRPLRLRADRGYLVTGGLGGIGLRLARWMVDHGARHLALLGRGEPSDGAAEILQELRRGGVEVAVIRADVSRLDLLTGAVERIQGTLPPLAGVVHCAGTSRDRLLTQHRWSSFEELLAAKLHGSWNLHLLTREVELDFFLLFSSVASLLPTPGLGGYVAANAFLDAFAHYRRLHGLPALAVGWGPWSGVGMAGEVGPVRESQWRSHGVDPLDPPRALESLGRLLGGGGDAAKESAHVGVFSVRWPELLRLFAGLPVPSFLAEVAAEVGTPAESSGGAGSGGRESRVFHTLLAMDPEGRPRFLESYLGERIAHALRMEPDQLSELEELADAGVDSLIVMDVLNAVREDLRFLIYPREFYEQPTLEGLARYVAAEFERAHGRSGEGSAGDGGPADGGPADGGPADGTPRIPGWVEALDADPGADDAGQEPLPAIGFVLSGPRTGSTLFRVMLAGHPRLFAPPELHLLAFRTLAERQRRLAGSHLGEGLQRALMALSELDAEASGGKIEEWLEEDLSAREVYARLQELAGTRLLIDKSPSYAVSRRVLARAERLFAGARYLHLVRHPYAAIESFVRLRMDKLLGLEGGDPFLVAEEIWTAANRNVLETLGEAAPDRYRLVRFEELVQNPEEVLTRCCELLGVPFHQAVLKPYDGGRMTDGVHRVSAPIDDPNFLSHDRVDPSLGEVWKEIDLGRRLAPATRELAAELGYDLPRDPAPAVAADAVPSPAAPSTAGWEMRESTVETPRGLRLCLCEWGPPEGLPVVLLHGILEQGASWLEVAPPLADRGCRVVAPDLRGHGRSGRVGAGGSYHLVDFLADLDAVAGHLGEGPFTLAGHSLGSVLAALFTAARPRAVGSLVLVEPVLPGRRDAGPAAGWERLASHLDHLAATPRHPLLPDLDAAASRMCRATPGLPEPLARKLAERHTVPVEGGVEWRWDPLLRTRAGLALDHPGFDRPRYLELLRQLPVPLTLVFGDASHLRRGEDRPEELAISGARTLVLSGGHNLHFEAPLAVAGILAEAVPSPGAA